MKCKFLALFLLVIATAYSDAPVKSNWNLTKDPSSNQTACKIHHKETTLGKVVRSDNQTPPYFYDLYDANDKLLVRGITRAFSLGVLFSWAMEIDLYDSDNWIGLIQGEWCTSSHAKFSFYDSKNQPTASAYLSDDYSKFLIVSEKDQGKVLAEFAGTGFGDTSVWEMKFMSKTLPLDEKALRIFAGFVADYQNSFLRTTSPQNHEVDVLP